MITILIIVIFAIVLLVAVSIAMKVAFCNQLSNMVTIADMYRCESIIRSKYERYLSPYRKVSETSEYLDVKGLAQGLKLEIVKDNESDLPRAVKGLLDAPKTESYYGTIRFIPDGAEKYTENFDIIHEIIHYLHDVGVGKRVDKSFARVHHGYQRGYQEQVRDYFTAAAAIPMESLQERISSYDGDPYDDEFVHYLMDIYQQPYNAVKRRIGEVMLLS